MWYVGLDVHLKQSTYCILDENGKRVKTRTVHGSVVDVVVELKKITEPFAVCFEASCGYGYLYDRLSKVAQRVAVAHPGHLRALWGSKRKNDRIDAQTLATVLFLDAVPAVHVPRVDIRTWRSLIVQRHGLVEERTGLKARVRAFLRGVGIVAPKRLWTKRNLAWLEGLAFESELDAVQRNLHVRHLRELNASIREVEKVLDREAARHPSVALLRTIPGVGIRTAEAVVAWIDDPRRFTHIKAIGRYFGLVPREDTSAGKQRLGHITQDGPAVVRRLLNQAAWQGIRRSAEIRAYYTRVRKDKRDRTRIAVVATMHYLARVMLAMLRTGEAWRPSQVPASA